MQTPIYLVVETSGSNAEHDYAKLEKFLEEAYEDEIIVDGTIAQDSSQQAAIWALRENISEGLRHAGKPLLPILLLPLVILCVSVCECVGVGVWGGRLAAWARHATGLECNQKRIVPFMLCAV